MKDNNNRSLWIIASLIIIPLIILLIIKNNDRRNTSAKNTSSSSPSIPIDMPNTNTQPTNTVTVAPPPSDKDSNGCYTPDNVRKHYGETACVDYNVGYVYETRSGTKFLDQLSNYTSGFVGYIPYNSNANNININSLNGKNIKISGYIQQYNGYPEIIINNPSQVDLY